MAFKKKLGPFNVKRSYKIWDPFFNRNAVSASMMLTVVRYILHTSTIGACLGKRHIEREKKMGAVQGSREGERR